MSIPFRRTRVPAPVAQALRPRPVGAALALAAAGFTMACAGDPLQSTGPSAGSVAPHASRARAQGTHSIPLTALVGEGTGHVNLTPDASEEGFSVQVQVSVRGTEPNAEFLLTRAVDFEADGECTGPTFAPLPRPNAGPLVLLTTSPAGAGAQHASFAFLPPLVTPPMFATGEEFDVHWEIRSLSGRTVLRSACVTVTVR